MKVKTEWKKERIYTDGDKFYHKDSLHGEVER